MVIILKKRNLFIFTLLFAMFFLCLFSHIKREGIAEVSTHPTFGKTIVLDAGHGEPDGGAVGVSGAKECDLNLKVTQYLKEYLEKNGTNVILTRADENGIFDKNTKNIKEKKVSDMHNREKIMNESGADLFVSIHMNKFTEAKYSGPQVFYASQFEEGKVLAECIQKELIKNLKPKMEREIKKSDEGIYLLRKASIPAVLIECGFLSNAEEEKLLKNSEYQKKIAWAIYKGINTYYR